MRPLSHQHRSAFTLLELLVVIALVAILAAIVLPVLSKAKAKGKRVQCLNNLKQMGVAFHAFAHDHGDRFPPQVSTNNGGSLEFAQAGKSIGVDFYFGFRHLQVLSNELSEPKLLICAVDTRAPALNFAALRNENVSYLIGVTAEYSKPDSILAGDRNITGRSVGTGAIVRLGADADVGWTSELHEYKGNMLFSDGRVEMLNGAGLLGAITHSPGMQNVFLTPIQTPPNTASAANVPNVPNPTGRSDAGSAAARSSALARLEELFPNKPGEPAPTTAPGSPQTVTSRDFPAKTVSLARYPANSGQAAESNSEAKPNTNSPSRISTNGAANPIEADISVPTKWSLPNRKLAAGRSYLSSYLWLLVLLAVCIAIAEAVRRLRRKKRRIR